MERKNGRARGRLRIHRSRDRAAPARRPDNQGARAHAKSGDGARAARFARRRVCSADIGQPASLKHALRGRGARSSMRSSSTAIRSKIRAAVSPSSESTTAARSRCIDAAKQAGVQQFIYISGAAADENSTHPGFRAKGRAERAIRESGLTYTIFRPSLVYGPEDKVVNGLARALRFAPVFGVPGTGRQKVQPVLVDDLAACVMLAVSGRGRNGTYEIGGPDLMTFDEMMRIIMDASGHRRPLFHIPEAIMRSGRRPARETAQAAAVARRGHVRHRRQRVRHQAAGRGVRNYISRRRASGWRISEKIASVYSRRQPAPSWPKWKSSGCIISARISSDSAIRGPGRLKY